MHLITRENKCKCILVICVFFFYLFLTAQIPYMQDDWNWGIDAGINSFLTADQNSRYAGNFIVLVLTRSIFLKNIVMATVFTAIPYMMVCIVDTDRKKESGFWFLYLAANVLMLIMPVVIWRQTYGWISGFANFVASLPFVCGHIILLQGYVFNEADYAKSKINHITLLAVFSFVGQLFIENLAVYFLAVYFFAAIYSFVKFRRVHPYILAAFLGVCVGLLVMFSSNLYDTLFSTGSAYDGYRKLTVDTDGGILNVVQDIIYNFRYQSAQQVTIEFYPQTVVILICMTVLLAMRKTKLAYLFALGNIGMGLIYAIVWGVGVFVPYRYKILFGLFYFAAILIEYIYLNAKSRQCATAALVWLSVYGVVIPLTVTNFAGGRLLLTSYMLVNIFALYLIYDIVQKLPVQKFLTICATISLLVTMLHYGQIYLSIGETDRSRNAAIETAIEQKTGTIYLEAYEYPDYMWRQDPIGTTYVMDTKWLWDYKSFYGIPSNYLIYIIEH